MSDPNDWNRQIIEEFRANEGAVGGMFAGMPLLLLHHKGAKTGTERVNPLAYQRLDDDSVAIFASKGGAPTNPDWYHNLVANPDASVEIGADSYPVRARVAQSDERDRIWSNQKTATPQFAEYEEKTTGVRTIPVVVLEKT
ncbi:MAG TPA: nitroreductase family deazaflavin-dependent oxidoreductase [Gaiellaceae bacterium]|jgi:deazaflavin-dependent oxidoreductase (nitroreductase family)